MTTDEARIAGKRKRVEKLATGNAEVYEELRKASANRFSMNTEDKRRELFYEKLIEWGIITEEQFLDYEIEFHLAVEEALKEPLAQLQEAKRGLSVIKNPTTLLGPNGQPLT